MIPNVDERVFLVDFELKGSEGCLPKPEAPWIKRCDFGIKFTDEEMQLMDPGAVSDSHLSSV